MGRPRRDDPSDESKRIRAIEERLGVPSLQDWVASQWPDAVVSRDEDERITEDGRGHHHWQRKCPFCKKVGTSHASYGSRSTPWFALTRHLLDKHEDQAFPEPEPEPEPEAEDKQLKLEEQEEEERQGAPEEGEPEGQPTSRLAAEFTRGQSNLILGFWRTMADNSKIIRENTEAIRNLLEKLLEDGGDPDPDPGLDGFDGLDGPGPGLDGVDPD